MQRSISATCSVLTDKPNHQSPVTPEALKAWKMGRLNHVAIAVPDLEKAISLYRDILGAEVSDTVVSGRGMLLSNVIT